MHLYLLLACSEYGIFKAELPASGDTADPVDTGIDTPEPTDTDEPDTDTEDPEDPLACPVDVAPAGAVTIDTTCVEENLEVPDPWNVEVEWHWTGFTHDPGVTSVMGQPLVAQLTDDNSDGLIDEDDDPDVVFVAANRVTMSDGWLVVLDGATGAEHWAMDGVYIDSNLAIADLDGDGAPEIIAVVKDDVGTFDTVAFTHTGSLLWHADTNVYGSNAFVPNIADIDGDGYAEVLADSSLVDGATGAIIEQLGEFGWPYRGVTVGDFDLDGDEDAIIGPTSWDLSTRSAQWTTDLGGLYGPYMALVDADTDPDAEIAMVTAGGYELRDDDGTILAGWTEDMKGVGPACAADLDGDGEVEIAWPRVNHSQTTELIAVELDGTELWTQVVRDSTGISGCSAFDLDHDGAAELLYADEHDFQILDGSTGDSLYVAGWHGSLTLMEYPIIADLDGDNDAEIIFGSTAYSSAGGDIAGLTVLGHGGSGWSGSGRTWAIHDYMESRIPEDNSVQSVGARDWQTLTPYRSRATDLDGQLANLAVDITDACVNSCTPEGLVQIAVQISNDGLVAAPAGVELVVHRQDKGKLTELYRVALSEVVGAGRALEALLFEMTYAEVGAEGLVVTLDDPAFSDEITKECGESNNIASWVPDCG